MLARIAENKSMKNLAAYLIAKEENLDKKIKFFFETYNYKEALSSSLKGGDQIVIYHVFSMIIAKQGEAKLVDYAEELGYECKRFLKNYGRNRR